MSDSELYEFISRLDSLSHYQANVLSSALLKLRQKDESLITDEEKFFILEVFKNY